MEDNETSDLKFKRPPAAKTFIKSQFQEVQVVNFKTF